NPWFDEEHLVGGQDWQVEIPKALATSDAIIICLTKNSVDKEGYIQKEIKFALDKALEMPEGRIFLIPVKFEECEVPFTLSRYQWVDLTVESGYAKMMKALKFRASQLERSTVELPKKSVEEENLALEKAARDKAEKEAVEKARLEAEERTREIAAREEERIRKEAIAKRRLPSYETLPSEKLEPEKLKPERLQPKKTKPFPKPNIAIIIALIVLVGTISAALISSPMLANLFAQTPEPATHTPDYFVTPGLTSSATPNTVATATVGAALTQAASFSMITASPTLLPTEITDAKGVSMVLVSSGEFTMGNDSGEDFSEDAIPSHIVYLDSYYIDKYEVTNALYKLCVVEGICEQPYNSDRYWKSSYSNHPVSFVDWNQANVYCTWRNARLPTEAEWEKAAHGTDGRTYPWGEEFDCEKANMAKPEGYHEYCVGNTVPVGSYEDGKSPYGVYDMAGNVWEWVSDWYSETYFQNSPFLNPKGPETGTERVKRGGSLEFSDFMGRTFYRAAGGPNSRNYVTGYDGFRCAMDATP
ncbi:MAG: SUMF1/EgtB/PvdO family nonheme iron enzyme, partial [Acidobacteria bacterium]|nr:SUMF1/EgtB/PvdO family nonheme iron enzyme [Acidobacteriota bacterium]